MPAYYSFLHYSQYGRGTAMDTKVISDTYDCRDFKEVPYLDAQAVMGEDESIKIFAINRSLEDALDLSVVLRGYEAYQVEKHIVLTADDPKATNTESEPFKVVPTEDGNARMEQGEVKAELAKMSWNVIVLKKI
jgi:alpha-N-arabinofuranosidase